MMEDIDAQSKKCGANLRKAVLERAGDTAGLESIDVELQQMDSITDSFLNDPSVINLLMNDESVLRDFLTNTEVYGQQEGMRRLVDEVERLQKTPGYDQCNFTANPFIRF